MFTALDPTAARWCNTGGDVQVHVVPAGTVLLDEHEIGFGSAFQSTTPQCGSANYQGGWRVVHHVNPPNPPYRLCRHCFPV